MNRKRLWEIGSTLLLILTLLVSGAPYFRQRHLNNELAAALQSGQDERIRALIARGADIRTPSAFTRTTVLHRAALIGDRALVSTALAKSAEVNVQTRGGWTPLMMSARRGEADIIRVLLTSGADPNVRDGFGQTALTQAVHGRHSHIVGLLAKAGADLDARDDAGVSAMAFARTLHFPEITAILKRLGARR